MEEMKYIKITGSKGVYKLDANIIDSLVTII